uniref:CARD domain-containing protein n=1 Tax=Sciurus vulgaris TaxID=55149 RepID=A0A8D2DH46_SCIVU
MADKRLKEERRTFISSVSEDTLHNLLDDVLTEEVLNQEEVERVKKKNATTKDKACDLIDLIIPKGSCASQKLIDYIFSPNEQETKVFTLIIDECVFPSSPFI